MAAKKSPSKSAPRPRRSAARKTEPAAPVHTPSAPSPAKKSGPSFPWGPVLVAVVLVGGLSWWLLKPKAQETAQPAPAPAVPVAVATSAPVAAVQPTAAPTASLAEEEPRFSGTHHHHHHVAGSDGGESSGSALVLSLKSGKVLSLSCWSSNGAPARLDIFTSHNRRIRSVLSAPGTHGWQTLSWDGRDQDGAPVRAGEYYARPSQKGDQVILDLSVKN